MASDEALEIHRLVDVGLPPITSELALSTMLGVNPGYVWSLLNRPEKHYRIFSIPKGKAERRIVAPKVGMKVVQKWLSVQLASLFVVPDHVYGFVAGRSHVQAAQRHNLARWVYSLDIVDFFTSTTADLVVNSLKSIGFSDEGSRLVARLCCFQGRLVQGSPASPVLSNIVFSGTDAKLVALAARFDVRVTRYADDIVFSGTGAVPAGLREDVLTLLDGTPWRFAPKKVVFSELPNRLKVHGLLVHGKVARLTKGYRNRLRALRHLLNRGLVQESDLRSINGHIRYADHVAALGLSDDQRGVERGLGSGNVPDSKPNPDVE